MTVCWRSKGQKGVTLLNSQAEYVALSNSVKDIRFIKYLLGSLGISIELPIVIRCINVRAMLMTENSSSGV